MTIKIRWVALLLLVALGACSNTVGQMQYRPVAGLLPAGAPLIDGVSAIDQRSEAPNRLATVMGGFGNPIKTLDTAKPVKDEVAGAFLSGLQARGLLAQPGTAPFRIALSIRKFDADMILGRTARIDVTFAVQDGQGRTIFQDRVVDQLSDFKFLQTGYFADIEDLRVMSQTLLNRTVDRLLDGPGFRGAIGG